MDEDAPAAGSAAGLAPGITSAAPPRVREMLEGPSRVAPVVHAGPLALYVDLDGFCLGVVSRTAAALPCALRTATEDLTELGRPTSAVVGDGALSIGEDPAHRVVVGRVVDPSVPRLDPDTLDFARVHLDPPRAVADELPSSALGALRAGDPAAVAGLVGLGGGLTPLGDDVIAGWLATHVAYGAPTPVAEATRARSEQTSLLSQTLLDCAARGEVLPQFRGLLLAIRTRDPATTRDWATALAGVGHTSGAGLLYGATLAAHHLGSSLDEGDLCR